MHDGRALQSGTSHYFGSKFAEAYDIKVAGRDNKEQYVYQTSWGMTTRIIGALIMVHGDDSGIILPPHIAPIQVMIIPIQQRKEGVLETAAKIAESLSEYRVKVDDSDRSPGYKFSAQEVSGIPLRIEIGPKDIAAGKAVIVRRDTREKIECAIDELPAKVGEELERMQKEMLERAEKHLEAHTFAAHNTEEFEENFKGTKGFVKAMWCGDPACEEKIKEKYNVTSRCIPFEQEHLSDVCVCCGRPAKKMVYWGRAY